MTVIQFGNVVIKISHLINTYMKEKKKINRTAFFFFWLHPSLYNERILSLFELIIQIIYGMN